MDGWLYRPAPLLGAMAVVCFGAVGLALVSQYRFDMQPCPWCTLQRLIFLLIGLLALLGTLLRSNGIRRVLAAGGLLLALCGMASAIWQHFVAAASASCNLTLADRIMQDLRLYDLLPEVFADGFVCRRRRQPAGRSVCVLEPGAVHAVRRRPFAGDPRRAHLNAG